MLFSLAGFFYLLMNGDKLNEWQYLGREKKRCGLSQYEQERKNELNRELAQALMVWIALALMDFGFFYFICTIGK